MIVFKVIDEVTATHTTAIISVIMTSSSVLGGFDIYLGCREVLMCSA